MSDVTSDTDIQIIEAFFKGYINGYVHDIEAAIQGQANYLTALGLAVYTEIIGGFITGNLGIEGESRRNFECFLFKYMGKSYEELMKRKNFDIYKCVRCGLVHEYFIKRNKGRGASAVSMYSSPTEECGIHFFEDYIDGEMVTQPIFLVEKYFDDFKKGIDKYRGQLVVERDPELINNFVKALQNI